MPTHPLLVGRERRCRPRHLDLLRRQCLVKDVFVGGRQVVKDRHHIHEDQIARNFRAAMRRLDT